MSVEAVGVSPQLAEVAQPGVGALDWPPQSHGLALGASGRTSLALLGDHGVVDPAFDEAGAGELGVIAPVEPQGLDVEEQTSFLTSSRVGASRIESLRLAPSVTQPIGTPFASVATDHFHPVFPLSVGLGPVPSPPIGALCSDLSTDTSERSRPINLSKALLASSTRCWNGPAVTHSSRRRRRVVSPPLPSLPATSQEHPVTSRNKMASKQSRSEILGR